MQIPSVLAFETIYSVASRVATDCSGLLGAGTHLLPLLLN